MSLTASADFRSSISSENWRLSHLYLIKNKRKESVLMRPNPLQIQIINEIMKIQEQRKPVRLVILKPRQIGCTTFFGIRYFDRVYWHKNQFAAMIAHLSEKADEIFNEIVKFTYDNLPREIKYKAYNDSTRHLSWRKIGSQMKVTTDAHGITPNMLHLTEVAHMRKPKEMIGEALQSVPRFGEVVQESTANGKGGYFYDCCMEAMNNPNSYWHFIFLKWWLHPDYSLPVPRDFEMDNKERELLLKYAYDGLTVGNLVFRREKINELLGSKRDEDTGLSGEMLFRQNYPMNPEDAFVTSSLSIFNIEKLETMRHEAPEPISTAQWGRGWFKAYEGKKDKDFYVVACDPSYGESSDYSAAIVFERKTGRMIAKLRGMYIPSELAKNLVKIGKFYNNALIVVERNSGHAVLQKLTEHYDYPMIYYHSEYDEKRNRVRKPGFYTGAKSRSIILARLEESIEDFQPMIPDKEVIEECLNFGYKDGKAQAIHGNDDCVLAYAIGNYICQMPSNEIMPPGKIDKQPGM